MSEKLDKVVAEAIKNKEQRAQSYREKAPILKKRY